MATAPPKPSPPTVSEAANFAAWDQAVPERTNTYTWFFSPNTAVSPEIARLDPKASPFVPSDALSLACCVHVPPERTNT